MACDCINKVTLKMVERLKKNSPKSIITGVKFKTQGYNFGTGSYNLYNEIAYTEQFEKVNGDLSKERTHTVDVYHSFCPFCGVKTKEAEEKQEGEDVE